MLSPGAGLGAEAGARMRVKKAHEALIEAINAFPVGSKEQQALLRVSQTLSLFAREAPAGPGAGGPPGGVPPGIAAMNAPGGLPSGGPPGMPPGGGAEPPMPGGPPV